MLVITRKSDQVLLLYTSDGVIRLTHCGHNHCGATRFGIEAPRAVRVVREEIEEMKPKGGGR